MGAFPQVDWSQQPGLLGGLARLYQHIMGANQVGTVPTQGMVNPQEYNPVSQVAQTAGMVAHPTEHKLDWLMAASPLAIGAAVGAGKMSSAWHPSEFHPDITNLLEDPDLMAELPPGSFHPKPYIEGKQNIFTHPDAPGIQIQHDPNSSKPFKVLHEGEVQSSWHTFSSALNSTDDVWNSEYPEEAASWSKGGKFDPFIPLKAQKGLSPKEFEPSKWAPDPDETTIENIYNKNSYTGKAYQLLHAGNDTGAQLLLNQFDKSGATWNAVKQAFELDKKKPSVLAQKIAAQISPPAPPLQDYGLNPMAKTASQLPVSRGLFGQVEDPQNLHQIISAKDSTYHATRADSAIEILKDGFIRPGYGEPLQLKGGGQFKTGVSTSRVPRVASKSTRAVNFVIDPKAVQAKTTPIAETGYGKTSAVSYIGQLSKIMNSSEYQKYNDFANAAPGHFDQKGFNDFKNQMIAKYGTQMNRLFEFEQRTAGKPITMNSVKGIIVDKSALSPSERDMLPQIQQMAKQRGLPYKEVSSGRELHTYRAKMSKTPAGQPMYGAGPIVGAATGAGALYQQMFGPKQQDQQ